MAKSKIKNITIKESKGTFNIFSTTKKSQSKEHDFSELSDLRKLLSNEKARLLDTIKTKSPGSIYELSKVLKRPFKAVNDDAKFLEKYGLIQLKKEKVKNRDRLKPIIAIDTLTVNFQL